MNIAPNPPAADNPPDPPEKQWIPFDDWLSQFGRTRQTGFRWRKVLPWLVVKNIMGRTYIAVSSARRFSELAAAGELAGRYNTQPAQAASMRAKKALKKATV